jgi:hypothetical protein
LLNENKVGQSKTIAKASIILPKGLIQNSDKTDNQLVQTTPPSKEVALKDLLGLIGTSTTKAAPRDSVEILSSLLKINQEKKDDSMEDKNSIASNTLIQVSPKSTDPSGNIKTVNTKIPYKYEQTWMKSDQKRTIAYENSRSTHLDFQNLSTNNKNASANAVITPLRPPIHPQSQSKDSSNRNRTELNHSESRNQGVNSSSTRNQSMPNKSAYERDREIFEKERSSILAEREKVKRGKNDKSRKLTPTTSSVAGYHDECDDLMTELMAESGQGSLVSLNRRSQRSEPVSPDLPPSPHDLGGGLLSRGSSLNISSLNRPSGIDEIHRPLTAAELMRRSNDNPGSEAFTPLQSAVGLNPSLIYLENIDLNSIFSPLPLQSVSPVNTTSVKSDPWSSQGIYSTPASGVSSTWGFQLGLKNSYSNTNQNNTSGGGDNGPSLSLTPSIPSRSSGLDLFSQTDRTGSSPSPARTRHRTESSNGMYDDEDNLMMDLMLMRLDDEFEDQSFQHTRDGNNGILSSNAKYSSGLNPSLPLTITEAKEVIGNEPVQSSDKVEGGTIFKSEGRGEASARRSVIDINALFSSTDASSSIPATSVQNDTASASHSNFSFRASLSSPNDTSKAAIPPVTVRRATGPGSLNVSASARLQLNKITSKPMKTTSNTPVSTTTSAPLTSSSHHYTRNVLNTSEEIKINSMDNIQTVTTMKDTSGEVSSLSSSKIALRKVDFSSLLA